MKFWQCSLTKYFAKSGLCYLNIVLKYKHYEAYLYNANDNKTRENNFMFIRGIVN